LTIFFTTLLGETSLKIVSNGEVTFCKVERNQDENNKEF
jgi:hypothetical protein